MNYFLFLTFEKIIEFKFVHEVCFICKVKQTKANLQTKCPPLLHNPPYICLRAIVGAKKGQQKVQIFKEDDRVLPLYKLLLIVSMFVSPHHPVQ